MAQAHDPYKKPSDVGSRSPASEEAKEQGDQSHPSPHVIAEHQQGIGRQSPSHGGAHGNRTEEEAQRGEPRGEHARGSRQHVPASGDPTGDRPAE
jgi:hypothetical protein